MEINSIKYSFKPPSIVGYGAAAVSALALTVLVACTTLQGHLALKIASSATAGLGACILLSDLVLNNCQLNISNIDFQPIKNHD